MFGPPINWPNDRFTPSPWLLEVIKYMGNAPEPVPKSLAVCFEDREEDLQANVNLMNKYIFDLDKLI